MRLNISTRIGEFLDRSRGFPEKFRQKKLIWFRPLSSMYWKEKKK